MSELRIYAEAAADSPEYTTTDFAEIQAKLAELGVDFERWNAAAELAIDASSDEVLGAYQAQIRALMDRHGLQSVDVVSMHPEHPQREAMRQKFLAEHVHDDFEVRFFVDGQGLFNIRANGRVYAMLCTRDDLINLPAGTVHWFDMGPAPQFKAIRLFTTAEGWVARFTGDPIAKRFPLLEAPAYA